MLLGFERTEKQSKIRGPFLVGFKDMPRNILEINAVTGQEPIGLKDGCVEINDIGSRDLAKIEFVEDTGLDLVKNTWGTTRKMT